MKQFYSRFRIMLLTFAVGLASVPFLHGIYEKYSEIPVDLPEVKSDSPIVVIVPTERRPFNITLGAGCGGRLEESIERKAK